MQKYFPLDAGVSFDTELSDLLGFDWQNRYADFIIPQDQKNVLRVSFRNAVIVRMLDEMPLSTESDLTSWKGLVPGHFAYRVEGDVFLAAQSELWKDVGRLLEHYRFMTGFGCLDVVTSFPPDFSVMPKT